jgi:TolB-like protein
MIASGLWWWQRWSPRTEPASPARMAFPLPDKPSIAVLPFDNLSADPEQIYFADGITEDLITDLSKVSGLFVVARASTFVYRERPATVKQVAEELGVSHVLEGSVRRSGARVRVTAQLIDATTGTHVWAERYDRQLEDVFALQDEVAQQIVSALAIQLTSDEEARLARSERTTPEAYDALLRGLELLRRFTPTTIVQGREMFEKAISLDPQYARAYANVAFAYAIGVFASISSDPEGDLEAALRFAREALALDAEVPQVHFSVSLVYWQKGRIEESLDAVYRALEVEPNYADGFAQLAAVLVYVGRYQESLEAIHQAMRLNPRHPFFYIAITGRAHFALGDYATAATHFEQALERNPDFVVARRELAAAYAHLGRIDDAEWEVAEILALQPDFSLSDERQRVIFQRGDDMARYIDGLRKAGVPE